MRGDTTQPDTPPPASPTPPQRTWRGRSHGGSLGTWLVAQVARIGLWPVHVFVAFPAAWFLVRDHEARRHSLAYWRHVRPGLGRWGRLFMTALQFHGFACALADRFIAALHPHLLTQRHRGQTAMTQAMRSRRGCLLLSAHIGNWELSGRWLVRYPGHAINIVMLDAEDPAVREQVARVLGDHPFHIISLNDPTAAGLAIAAALGRGETCCMLADRTAGTHAQTRRVPFLGQPAAFPLGPFVAAAVTGAWIVPTFALADGPGAYRMVAEPPYRITWRHRVDRPAAIDAGLRRWVATLERRVRRHALQWHNFHDFWG